MNLKKIFGGILAAAAIGATAAPAQARTVPDLPSPEELAKVQQNLTYFYPAMQSAITAYFNSHGLQRDQAKSGLVIPWVVTQPITYAGKDFWGKPTVLTDGKAVDYVHGYAVAQGRTIGGCPVFQMKGVDDRDIRWRQSPAERLVFPRDVVVCP